MKLVPLLGTGRPDRQPANRLRASVLWCDGASDLYKRAPFFLWRVYAVSASSISISYAVCPNLRPQRRTFRWRRKAIPCRSIGTIISCTNCKSSSVDVRRSPHLRLNVISRACFRFHAHRPELKARVACLIDCGAYSDAALALLDMELPHWKLRRLTFDDGAWYCALSKQPGIPAKIDDMA